MKRILVGFIICFLFWNCGKKEEKIVVENKPYIISLENRKFVTDLKKRKIPLPPKGFYGESQLIIDKDGNLFFYQKEYFMLFCNYGHENDTLPEFLNLKPKDIVKIPQISLNDFLSENILTKEKNRQILVIASQNDTIKNTSFMDFLIKNQLFIAKIRRTTQEEDTVLHFIKSKNITIIRIQSNGIKQKLNFLLKTKNRPQSYYSV